MSPESAEPIGSIEDLTPTERAQLGLWRMTGERLGDSRQLHPVAQRYQKAAYQRQAAQRMVAMLDDYGGAMLCDGVGLGKTYVATALIVHYANLWADEQFSTNEDPYRVTVLAPNSVVTTWRREALPGLSPFGVAPTTVRVISHTKLSRVSRGSELLQPSGHGLSDLEHLLLSDLVIVDEAHNFRSLAARRTKVLRDLLRLQPRREVRRRVALLTATPLNNTLEDLRQQLSLLFSRSLLLSDAKTDEGYRRQALAEIRDRCARARSRRVGGEVSALVVHGNVEARFSDAIEFRDDLNLGQNVQRISDYLNEQARRLNDLQASIRIAAHTGEASDEGATPVRIAEDLLDRVVVQRSRKLCQEIESQQNSATELLFRPDAGEPERLHYSDEYDGIKDVLARFLPLFERTEGFAEAGEPLSFRIYMWSDVRDGVATAEQTSSVVALQRVLVLKRLESSPVAFLVTLLRLTVLHAHRLQQLLDLCLEVGDEGRHATIRQATDDALNGQGDDALEKLRTLATAEDETESTVDLLGKLSAAYSRDQSASNSDDPPPQMPLFDFEWEAAPKRQQLERLWPLREAILRDFELLLAVTPGLADIIFGRFDRSEWPRRFIAGGGAADWPRSAQWGLRLVTDAKIRQLVGRLITARRTQQKAIVFSQFSDTIAYIRSVLEATREFGRSEWQLVERGLGVVDTTREEVVALRNSTATITGDTEARDDLVNSFAPFYRIGPWRPTAATAPLDELASLSASWEASWRKAMDDEIDVLIATDVLAEGVNLQDAALLINFDVHWNPVRMIQRSGRIDRRLNPRIEESDEFPDIVALATRLGKVAPSYYWLRHVGEGPTVINMILPDELEAELQLRERIASKTLAIDFTLGLEQGTGAEADWMTGYKYHGIKSLNSFQRDRAIEQLAGHHDRLSSRFLKFVSQQEWGDHLNGWFRALDADQGSPLIARATMGLKGTPPESFSRYLEPLIEAGIPHWYWAEKRPGDSLFDGWLLLDGTTWPPPSPRRDLPSSKNAAGPVTAEQLLYAVNYLEENIVEDWSATNRGVGRLLLQGASAIAAPKLGDDRELVRISNIFILQLRSFETAGIPVNDEQRNAE
jgi:hypothetical protein